VRVPVQQPRKWGVGRALAVAAGVGAAAAAVVVARDDGLRRSAIFWTRAMPVFMHYKYVQYRTRGMDAAARTAEFEKVRVHVSANDHDWRHCN
jgi:hypothetical protein